MSPLPTDLPTVPAATRRELRRAAKAVLVPVEGYKFQEPDPRAATTITSLALPVMIEAFGEQVPPGVLMREFLQENRQYGFVLVGVVPLDAADRDASERAAFRLAGVLAQAQTPPTVMNVSGIRVNRLKNPENEADVATWSPDGATVVAVVSFGPAHADALTNGLIVGSG